MLKIKLIREGKRQNHILQPILNYKDLCYLRGNALTYQRKDLGA